MEHSTRLAHISEDGTRTQTVYDHLAGTARLAGSFAAPFGAQSEAEFAAWLHDVGKYSDAFQLRLKGGPKVDHSTAGAQEAWVRQHLHAAFAVAGHHSGLPDGGSPADDPGDATLFGRSKKPAAPYDGWQEVTLPTSTPPAWACADPLSLAFFTRMLYSCLVDADFIDTETFMDGKAAPRGNGTDIAALRDIVSAQAQRYLSAESPSPVSVQRNTVLRACLEKGAHGPQGLYTLTVPTGGGKTFASLAFALEHAAAQKMKRVIYVIPYMSIIDQTAAVFSGLLGAENVLADFSNAEYKTVEQDDLTPAQYRQMLASENWDAPVIVTTAVQFFESLYANRSSRCRKLHNIADSVIIFDEAQTLPLDSLKPCISAIAQLVQHYHATAVLCTATQPALESLFKEFAPELHLQEISPDTETLYETLRRTTIRDIGTLPQEELAAQLAALPQVLCVVNRRKTAQDAAARKAAQAEDAASKAEALLTALRRSGFASGWKLENLTADTLPQLTDWLAAQEKPLEEAYFAARQNTAALRKEQADKRAELDAVSGGKWVYPHGDAATRVRDAVNAELKSRGMQPDAKIFCELLAVADESWQDCVEACLGDRRFDILVPPAHYEAAKSAFVALKDKVGPISLLDTPGIRKANRHAETAPADSLAAQVTSENPLAAQYADTILRRIVCCDTPETLEQYPDSATRDLLRHHPFRLERLRTPQRYIGLEARRARAGALAEELEALAERTRTAAQTEQNLKTAYDQYQNFQRGTAPQQLAGLWEARTAAEKARNAVAEQEGKLAEYRENPLLQEMYREEETREAAWEAARTAVEQVGGDIRVCEKQIASCEAEQKKAGETAQQSADAARKFFAAHPLLEPLARTRMQALAPADKPAAAAQAAEKAQARLDDALTAYLTGTLEPAQKAYNEHYVCDYPLGLAGLDQYRAQHESLVRIDLERYAARLEQAQRDCKDRFRKDILFRMKDDIFNARRQFRELNKVMEQLTYGEEVYRFELGPSRDPQLAAFYQVIVDKGNQQMTDGDSLDNLAATADPVYERQVDELMEKIMADVDENTRARQEGRRPENVTLSDYVDYRTYLDYDIKVTNTVSGQQASLSRVSRDSSGGENQAPFYVAICASLLQIYQKSENSIRLVLLDEAFSKMTSDRIRPMMELFRRLQLQVILISTVEKSTAIQPYCDITYSIVRHGDANAIAPFIRLAAE